MVVQRAALGAKNLYGSNAKSVHIQIPGIPTLIDTTAELATDVLCLLNMITPDDLCDDDEYEDIVDDIREECNKIGSVRSIEIPRPMNGVDVAGCGKVCKLCYGHSNWENPQFLSISFLFHS